MLPHSPDFTDEEEYLSTNLYSRSRPNRLDIEEYEYVIGARSGFPRIWAACSKSDRCLFWLGGAEGIWKSERRKEKIEQGEPKHTAHQPWGKERRAQSRGSTSSGRRARAAALTWPPARPHPSRTCRQLAHLDRPKRFVIKFNHSSISEDKSFLTLN